MKKKIKQAIIESIECAIVGSIFGLMCLLLITL